MQITAPLVHERMHPITSAGTLHAQPTRFKSLDQRLFLLWRVAEATPQVGFENLKPLVAFLSVVVRFL